MARQIAPASSFESPNPAKCAWWCHSMSRPQSSQVLTSTDGEVKGRLLKLLCAAWRSSLLRYFNHKADKACANKPKAPQTRLEKKLQDGKSAYQDWTQTSKCQIQIQPSKISCTFQDAHSTPHAWPYPSIPSRQPQRFGHNHPILETKEFQIQFLYVPVVYFVNLVAWFQTLAPAIWTSKLYLSWCD